MANHSILLVDDDANFRRALRIALRLEGLAVHEAASLDEADELLRDRTFDCAVINLLVAGMEALGLLERLERRHPGLGRIACSAHPELLGAARRRGDNVVLLEKPFTVETLLQAAEPWLASRRAASN